MNGRAQVLYLSLFIIPPLGFAILPRILAQDKGPDWLGRPQQRSGPATAWFYCNDQVLKVASGMAA